MRSTRIAYHVPSRAHHLDASCASWTSPAICCASVISWFHAPVAAASFSASATAASSAGAIWHAVVTASNARLRSPSPPSYTSASWRSSAARSGPSPACSILPSRTSITCSHCLCSRARRSIRSSASRASAASSGDSPSSAIQPSASSASGRDCDSVTPAATHRSRSCSSHSITERAASASPPSPSPARFTTSMWWSAISSSIVTGPTPVPRR
jgi:hypothetical protein